jgi:hypothetical protein
VTVREPRPKDAPGAAALLAELGYPAAVEAFAGARGCALVEVTSGERPEREAAHRFNPGLGYEQVSRRYLKEL